MTDHVIEDYDLQYHVTIENHVEDHTERQYVISNQHIILVRQQQLKDLRSQHKDIT